MIRESLGKTWQGILGWGNRTKEALETTSQNIATNAKEATQNLQTKSSGKSKRLVLATLLIQCARFVVRDL